MKLNHKHVALLVIVVLIGGYTGFKLSGIWDRATDSTPKKIEIENENKEFVEVYDPAEIRGSAKFKELSEWFDIPIEVLGNAFMIPKDQWDTFANKNLETIYGELAEAGTEIGNGSVKYFIALYKKLPYEIDPNEPEYLPVSAVEILKEQGGLSEETLKAIEVYSVELPKIAESEVSDKLEIAEESHGEELFEVKGKTTFQEVIANGMPEDRIEEILGRKLPQTTMVIRDYCEKEEIEFSSIKESINEYFVK